MIRVAVLQSDIDDGVRHSCHSCPVANALTRATGDREARVSSFDWQLCLTVWGRTIPAPWEVVEFVHNFDDGNRVKRFGFELPDQSDPEWKEACSNCGDLFDSPQLDDEGFCEECRQSGG